MDNPIPAAALQVAALVLGQHRPALADPCRLRMILEHVEATAPACVLPAEPAETGHLLSPAEAAHRLGISRRSLAYHISAGKIVARRLGHRTVRIAEADLLAFIQAAPLVGGVA